MEPERPILSISIRISKTFFFAPKCSFHMAAGNDAHKVPAAASITGILPLPVAARPFCIFLVTAQNFVDSRMKPTAGAFVSPL